MPPWNLIVNDLFGGLMIGEEGAPSYGVMGTNLQATPHQPAFRNVPTPFTYKLLAVAGRLAAGRTCTSKCWYSSTDSYHDG